MDNFEFKAKVTNLEKLIEYQRKAIVSRTIIDEDGGTVTLFAFDETEGLSEHTAPYDALIYIINGEVEVTIANETLRLKAGEMTIIPANKPHSLRALMRFKMLLIMIKSS